MQIRQSSVLNSFWLSFFFLLIPRCNSDCFRLEHKSILKNNCKLANIKYYYVLPTTKLHKINMKSKITTKECIILN